MFGVDCMMTDLFRGSLYDDVLENLSDVRRQAMDNMRKIRERSGTLKGEKRLRIKRETVVL
jgi:hypothetical protein